jgi:hypothetical protein
MRAGAARASRARLLLLVVWTGGGKRAAASGPEDATSAARQAVVDPRGLNDDESAGARFALSDHAGRPLDGQPQYAALDARCQQSLRRATAEAAAATPPRLQLYPDPLAGVTVAPRPRPDAVRLVYFILASRPSAPATVSRLVRALYHPSHLFLVHVDLKANASTHDALAAYAASRPNLHVMRTRRLVQWGGFSVVAALLDAIESFVHRVDFDFLINLSDADLALRARAAVSRRRRARPRPRECAAPPHAAPPHAAPPQAPTTS